MSTVPIMRPADPQYESVVDPALCCWCGRKLWKGHRKGAPYFCSVTCSWQFATAAVREGVTFRPYDRSKRTYRDRFVFTVNNVRKTAANAEDQP